MQGLFSKCVDENWEGSLKSRVSKATINNSAPK